VAPPLVRCAGVTYRYDDGPPALVDLDLTLSAGEFVVVAGASGSGKSTFCRLLNGLIPHVHGGELRGAVTVAGHDVAATPPHVLSPTVGLVLQNPAAQCFSATVGRDLAFGPACQGLDRAEIAARVRAAAELTGVSHLLERAPHALSGGEQQRVAIAGVLAARPALLALDEPFAFLDADGAERLRAILRRLRAEGVTIVVAEHRLQEVAADATRLLVLAEGRLAADGEPRALLAGDVSAWGLEPPPTVRLARQAGLAATPLTVEEAEPLLRGRPLPPLPRSGSAPGEPVVVWEEVWFARDGAPVLSGASLAARAGGVSALLGANGAGKTTLLQHSNGLLRPRRGEVRVLGAPIGRRPVGEIARDVALVGQQPARLLFAASVAEELLIGPRALGRDDPAWRAALVERLELGPLLDRPPQRLSAGQQRRVALAALLAARPRALLLDEPTAGLDAAGRRALGALARDCAQQAAAVLLSTHDTEWAWETCDRWALLTDGRISAEGPPAEVCARPALVAAARLRLPAAAALATRDVRPGESHAVDHP
jgi:energy-coupling factor transporter ATP-binding protein EcfA2